MRKIAIIVTILAVAIVIYTYRIVLLAIGSLLYVYLMPGLISKSKRQVHAGRVLVACALFGWLILPWLGALIYAYRAPRTGIEELSSPFDETWTTRSNPDFGAR